MAKKPATTTETSTELALFTSLTPVTIVTDQAKAEELFTHIEQQIAEFVPDLTTDTGRRAIASLAFKVSKTKTAITAAAEELIEEERKKVASTVAERKRIEERLDALRDKARQPLTDWEKAEADRQRHFDQVKAGIASAQIVQPTDTVATLREELVNLADDNFAVSVYGEERVETLKVLAAQAREVLEAAIARMEQQERDRLELEQLRQERAEKARQEAEAAEAARIAEEEAAAAQRAADEAQRIADEERVAQEQAAENARLEAAAEQRRIEAAQEAAQLEERRRADQALEDQRKAHEAELEAANQRAADAERRAQQELESQAFARAEEKRLADEAAAEAAARAQDQENRRKVKTDAKNAFMACGADEQTAKNIVLSIIAGEIPNVTLNF